MIDELKKVEKKITGIGSLPFLDLKECIDFIKKYFKDIPFLPQLPKLNFKEDMNIQVVENMPGIRIENRKILFEYNEKEILNVYQKIEENEVDYFKISNEYGEGIYEFLKTDIESNFLKGQLVGPLTFLSTAKFKDGKPLIFEEVFEDIFVKIIGMKGIYLSRKIKGKSKIPIIFFDEPVMSSYGSAFFPVEKDRIVNILKNLVNFFRERDKSCLIGFHCCGNTDWSIFFNLDIDILSFDAFGFLENFLIYWEEIEKFIKKERFIAWGIIPSTDEIENVDFEAIKDKFNFILKYFEKRGVEKKILLSHSIFTPSCGLGYTKEKNSYKNIDYLNNLIDLIQSIL
ncbi:MAG TPA: hypothetical protein PKV21_04605 [bacterium]|nr:hypothetical protein [bacterium]HOM26769.1 hypothetical protein [bacterium]